MQRIPIVLALLAVGSIVALNESGAGDEKKGFKATQKWPGKVADEKLRAAAPKSGVLANQKAVEQLWAAWMLKDKAPAIDFKKHLVLVHTVGGPNSLGASYSLDANGDLRSKVATTLIAGPGFAFSIELVPREGVKTYLGKPIE